jgi:glutamine amidotransferase
MICIIDYDLGNVISVKNAINKIGFKCIISRKDDDILNSKGIILPGVGSFEKGINNLKKYNLIKILNQDVMQNKKKILGICLGFQLMCKTSEEFGCNKGLGWLNADVKKINTKKLRLPHVGWNKIKISNKRTDLFKNIDDKKMFYFNHSYCVYNNSENNFEVIAESNYGTKFVAVARLENIYGIQPHPEKSQKQGLKFLENFCKDL